MKWSWKFGRFAGIDVYIHATFLLVFGWIALIFWLNNGTLAAMANATLFILALFACVVLHEYGHALTARHYGIQTKDITLLPIGGLARLQRMPEKPIEELWVALAGPAVNVALSIGLYAWLTITGGFGNMATLSISDGPFFERLLVANVFLAAFNMLPAFPMDGGRVLRALLATRMDYIRATQVAAALGQSMALLFGLAGLFLNPFLIFIALFVWIGADQESAATQVKYSLSGTPLRSAMITNFRTLTPDDSLAHAADLILSGSQQDFPVIDHGRVTGILTRANLVEGLSHHPETDPVSEAMERDFEEADPGDMLSGVFERLQGKRCHTIPVVRDHHLVGMVTLENVGEYMMIRTATNGHHTPPVGAQPLKAG